MISTINIIYLICFIFQPADKFLSRNIVFIQLNLKFFTSVKTCQSMSVNWVVNISWRIFKTYLRFTQRLEEPSMIVYKVLILLPHYRFIYLSFSFFFLITIHPWDDLFWNFLVIWSDFGLHRLQAVDSRCDECAEKVLWMMQLCSVQAISVESQQSSTHCMWANMQSFVYSDHVMTFRLELSRVIPSSRIFWKPTDLPTDPYWRRQGRWRLLC